jgi:hypothetical protein
VVAKPKTYAEHYEIPKSPYAGTLREDDVVRSGLAQSQDDGVTRLVIVASAHTKLPERSSGPFARLLLDAYEDGWRLKPVPGAMAAVERAVERIKVPAPLRFVLIAQALDAVLPGVNAIVGSGAHSAIDETVEARSEHSGIAPEPGCISYIDVVDVDYRSIDHGGIRGWSRWKEDELSVEYVRAQGARATLTFHSIVVPARVAPGRRFIPACRVKKEDFLHSFFSLRWDSEILAVRRKVMRAYPSISDEQKIRERVLAELRPSVERYAGLPRFDETLQKYAAGG